MRIRAIVSLPLLLAMAACGATQAPMSYVPTVAVQPAAARPVIQVADRVSNERRTGREDPTWIGTIRGGYGNPLKALHADRPVDQVVGNAFTAGLTARGLSAATTSTAPYALAITIHQFDANQFVRREATADFTIVLTERETGREVWRAREKIYIVDGSILSLSTGIFASIDDLQRVALQAMNEAVDKLLDKPGLREALRA